jgi:hypothetical protein
MYSQHKKAKVKQRPLGGDHPLGGRSPLGGEGLGDIYKEAKHRLKSLISKDYRKQNLNRKFEKYLQENGNKQIESIEVGRKPINKNIDTVLNIMSGGRYNKKKKELKYDDVYHQFLIVKYKDGTKRKIEKNSSIEASEVKEEDENNVFVKLPTKENTNLKDVIERTKEKYLNYDEYSAEKNNCQDFVKKVVKANDLLPDNIDEEKVLQTQNAKELIDTLPSSLRNIPFVATEIARIKDRVIDGGRIKLNNKRNLLRVEAMIDGLI